jgi:hypothetical protein
MCLGLTLSLIAFHILWLSLRHCVPCGYDVSSVTSLSIKTAENVIKFSSFETFWVCAYASVACNFSYVHIPRFRLLVLLVLKISVFLPCLETVLEIITRNLLGKVVIFH